MFNYRKNNNGNYFISGDGIVGEFGPFESIYIKNSAVGVFSVDCVDLDRFPGYKYSIGKKGEYIYIINNTGLEDVVKNTSESE